MLSKSTAAFALVCGALLLVFGGLEPVCAQSKVLAEVPFEFVSNQIVVQVKIAGKGPYSMLVDTDTDPSAIDLATAREIGLVQGSKGYPATGGGQEVTIVHATRLPLVELGGITAKDVAAATIDLAKLAGKMGRPIHGVLGHSFLRDRIIQIDYPESKLRFYSESPYPGIELGPNTVNKIAVAFRYDEGVLIDSVFINGQRMKATLDTGSSGAFALTPEAITILGLEDEAHDGNAEEAVGYNGAYQHKTGSLKSFRLGRLSITEAPATFWQPGTGHDKKKYQVNIGNGFFKDYILTFDYRGKIVVFETVE